MPIVPFAAFTGGSYQGTSVNASSELTRNWLVERMESPQSQSPYPSILVPTPGLANYVTSLRGPIRGAFAQDGRAFVVGGDTLYELTGYNTALNRGTVAVDDEPVSMASNGHGGHQLCVISAGLGYIFDLNTSTLTQITVATFPANAVMVDFLDGYFIVMQATTSTFYLSDRYNGLTGYTDVGQVNSSSDQLRGFRVINRYLVFLGTQRSEFWVDTGGSFPFSPIPGALLEWGLGATWSLAEAEGRIFFVATDERGTATIRATNGQTTEKVSTIHQDRVLSLVADVSSVRTFTYQERGHTYVAFCPNTGLAQVLDLSTGIWHERGVWNPGTGSYDPLRQTSHMFVFGKHLVGDRAAGTVYEQSVAYGTDAGTPIRRQRRCPHVNQSQQWFYGRQVTMGAECGLATPADPAPVLDLSFSRDSGHTFTAPQTASLGVGGDYGHLVKWTRTPGQFADLVLDVTTSAETPVSLLSCDLWLEPGLGQR